jgi:hypothetical protein
MGLIRDFLIKEFNMNCGYKLPGDTKRDIYMIPISGGVDSTAMAIMLHKLFPNINFVLVFTDTMVEPASLYSTLDKLEKYLGKTITRITPKKGFFELIEQYGGFLPNSLSRYCTRQLKTEPFEAFCATLRKSEDTQVWSFVGIRADENFRVGLLSHMDWMHSEYPFKELGIKRADVFRMLDDTIGIPEFYRYKTRSGCSCCFFQRTTELIGLLQQNPEEYAIGENLEKLSPADSERWPTTRLANLASQHFMFPIPRKIDCMTRDQVVIDFNNIGSRSKSTRRDQVNLFTSEQRGLWVGAELWVHPGVGDHGVWWFSLAAFSTSKSGLQRQLQDRFNHIRHAPEAFGASEEEALEECKYAIYYIEAPADLLDTDGTTAGSFTWKQGTSYKRHKHIYEVACKVLNVVGHQQTINRYAKAKEGTWAHEYRTALEAKLSNLEKVGEVIFIDEFIPSRKVKENLDENTIPCIACSL